MRVLIVGLGVQGLKRLRSAGSDVSATVDPDVDDADFRDLHEVPLSDFDAALLCIPDRPKISLISYLLENGKHVLVEKPLLSDGDAEIELLSRLAERSGVVCYTAYNHRFEPHFIRMRDLIASGKLGTLYALRMFYGNGTARLVRNSAWRDQGAGVLPDLGSHLLDTLRFWLGDNYDPNFEIRGAYRHENRAFDHVIIGNSDSPAIQLEMTMLSWRNHFTCDIFAENGSAHIESLCKWGPSTFTHRERVLPSGRPPEESCTLVKSDPTWDSEYAHFIALCRNGNSHNLDNDLWLNKQLRTLAAQAGAEGIGPIGMPQ